MRNDRLLLTAIGGAAVLGLAATALVARSDDHAGHMAVPAHDHALATVSQDYGHQVYAQSFEGMGSLDVEMDDADIVLREVSGDRIEVAFYIETSGGSDRAREVFEQMHFQVETHSGRLIIESRDNDFDDYDRRDRRRMAATAVIGIPAKVRVSARTGDGDISADRLTSEVDLSTGDGDVQVTTVEASRFHVRTGDGDIHIGQLFAAESRISTGDGDIHVEQAASALEATTGDGDLTVTLVEAHETRIGTGDGDVNILAPASMAVSFRLEAEDFRLAPGMEIQGRVTRDLVEGSMNGGGPLIVVRTGDGTISVRESR